MAGLPPLKNAAYTFDVSLVSQGDTDIFQVNPTLAAGDVKVSKDGGAFVNIGTLPAAIGGGAVVTATLAAGETADRVAVLFHDAAGDEWQDLLVFIEFETQQIRDLSDGTGVTLADDAITAAKYDQSTAYPLVSADSGATQVARTGADGDTLETLSDQIDGVPAATWVNSDRTLTNTPAELQTILDGVLTRYRGTTWTISLTLGAITGYTRLWFTIKDSRALATIDDDNAIVKIDSVSGLEILAGAAIASPITSADGSIVVNDEATGAITITLSAAASALLTPSSNLKYDVKVKYASSTTLEALAAFTISSDVTRET